MKSNLRKICVVTGTRAEYGILRHLISLIQLSNNLDLQLIVTGSHLSPEYGMTINEIAEDSFFINKKIEILLSSDSTIGTCKSMGLAMISFAEAYSELQPDLVLLLGDRFEIFAAATAAMIARIPIAHCHGGESTEGLIDEPIRHSITKMSHIHFVSTEKYAQRVQQLGESPTSVYNVGALSLDAISTVKLLSRSELEEALEFSFLTRNLLITFHPVTLENDTSYNHIVNLLEALSLFTETGLIFTLPNADANNKIISAKIQEFCEIHQNAKCYTSLGQKNYFSCLKYVDGVVGNSSSGLIEVPSFKKATINIGDRQRGRIYADSVVNCEPSKDSIVRAIQAIYSSDFQAQLLSVVNPYGMSGAANKIINVLENLQLVMPDFLKKRFHDWV